MGSEIPFECKWIDAKPVCCIRILRHQKKWNDVHGVFKASTQKTWPVSIGQNPAITCADIKHAVTRLTPIRSMPSARPDLKLVAALLGAGLRAKRVAASDKQKPRQRRQFRHCKILCEHMNSFGEGLASPVKIPNVLKNVMAVIIADFDRSQEDGIPRPYIDHLFINR